MPRVKVVPDATVRRMFNQGLYHSRLLRGEFQQRIIRSRPAQAKLGFPPGTLSQIVAYQDSGGHTIAKVHQYLKPDGSLAASGKPDPKTLLVGGILYTVNLMWTY